MYSLVKCNDFTEKNETKHLGSCLSQSDILIIVTLCNLLSLRFHVIPIYNTGIYCYIVVIVYYIVVLLYDIVLYCPLLNEKYICGRVACAS